MRVLLSAACVHLAIGCSVALGSDQEGAKTISGLLASTTDYTARYNLTTPFQTAVGDNGRGMAELQGFRNFRAVLPGILYRAGANNDYRATYGKANLKTNGPLPEEAINNLCDQGFAAAYYVYATASFHQSPINCNYKTGKNSLSYAGLHPQYGGLDTRKFLEAIHAHIIGDDHRPVLVHCWNGYHASGVASAIALRQFCSATADDAAAYWNTTAQPLIEPNKSKALATIRNFKPIPELEISQDQRSIVCFHGPLTLQKAQWYKASSLAVK